MKGPGQKNVEILYYSLDLIWKPRGGLVRLVFVIDPQHGKFILMSTDLTLNPLDVVRIYGFRFKIEVSFKSSLRILAAYSYRFWSKLMNLNRRGSGDQNLDEKSENYCKAIFKKLLAYEALHTNRSYCTRFVAIPLCYFSKNSLGVL